MVDADATCGSSPRRTWSAPLSWAYELGRTDVLMGTGSGPATAADVLIGHVVCSHPAEPQDEIELEQQDIAVRWPT